MISSCCWEVAPVTFSVIPADADLHGPARPRGKPAHGGHQGAQPVQGPELGHQPASHIPEPFGPLRGRPGGKRADRGLVHAKQLSVQLCGQIRQLLRVAVRHRQHLHD